KLDGLLMPHQYFPYFPVRQSSEVSAPAFHGRLLIDQAHCLRDWEGTAPASGHGSKTARRDASASARSSVTAEDGCARLLAQVIGRAGPLSKPLELRSKMD